jgi:hypothetical protein
MAQSKNTIDQGLLGNLCLGKIRYHGQGIPIGGEILLRHALDLGGGDSIDETRVPINVVQLEPSPGYGNVEKKFSGVKDKDTRRNRGRSWQARSLSE